MLLILTDIKSYLKSVNFVILACPESFFASRRIPDPPLAEE